MEMMIRMMMIQVWSSVVSFLYIGGEGVRRTGCAVIGDGVGEDLSEV